MKTITASAAKNLAGFLTKDFRKIFGPGYDEIAERLGSLARSTIECLGRSDALRIYKGGLSKPLHRKHLGSVDVVG